MNRVSRLKTAGILALSMVFAGVALAGMFGGGNWSGDVRAIELIMPADGPPALPDAPAVPAGGLDDVIRRVEDDADDTNELADDDLDDPATDSGDASGQLSQSGGAGGQQSQSGDGDRTAGNDGTSGGNNTATNAATAGSAGADDTASASRSASASGD
jgi:hypothetical protein